MVIDKEEKKVIIDENNFDLNTYDYQDPPLDH